jgi:Lrp/AsnC family transcriptional regulator, leucine-responsive regulatory protein
MPSPPRLDEIDRMILALLRENGRRTVADIAARVNLSPAPVRRRITQLEAVGVILGYTAVVDEDGQLPAVDAFVELRLESGADVTSLAREVRGMPEVTELSIMAGDPDVVVRLRVADIARLRAFVHVLRQHAGVASTKTMVALDTWRRHH